MTHFLERKIQLKVVQWANELSSRKWFPRRGSQFRITWMLRNQDRGCPSALLTIAHLAAPRREEDKVMAFRRKFLKKLDSGI